MGSDDLFHKRKARSSAELKRKNSQKKPYAKILIVCEGEKTEPLYFDAMIKFHKLVTVTVKHRGSAPISVVNGAEALFSKSLKSNEDPYDQIYCVFDRDNHESFEKAVDKIHTLNNMKKFKNKIFAIVSVRQFEFWLLLHFRGTTKPFNNGDDLLRALRKYDLMKDYEKGTRSYYKILGEERYLAAKTAAEKINTEHKENKPVNDHSYANPSTDIYKLTEVLRELKKTQFSR